MTPDINAEIWEGATGWASGSQTCRGTIPAFKPKPIKAKVKAMVAQVGLSVAAFMAAKLKPSEKPARTP